MHAQFKGKGVSQIDVILIDGKEFTEKQIKKVLKDVVPWSKKKIKERDYEDN